MKHKPHLKNTDVYRMHNSIYCQKHLNQRAAQMIRPEGKGVRVKEDSWPLIINKSTSKKEP